MKKQIMVALVALIGLSTGVEAQNGTTGARTAQTEQQKRTTDGNKPGNASRSEARNVKPQQPKREMDKMTAKSRGMVAPGEHHQMKKGQRRASAPVHKEKHDAQERK
jgi:hypothetical protein